MKKITYAQLEAGMLAFNKGHPDKQDTPCKHGVIVYKESNWPGKNYSLGSRSYEVWNCNRGFQPGKISNSVRGDSLDGSDRGVRLDWYKWDVDYCYWN